MFMYMLIRLRNFLNHKINQTEIINRHKPCLQKINTVINLPIREKPKINFRSEHSSTLNSRKKFHLSMEENLKYWKPSELVIVRNLSTTIYSRNKMQYLLLFDDIPLVSLEPWLHKSMIITALNCLKYQPQQWNKLHSWY